MSRLPMKLQSWRQLFADRAGNVTITFALAFLPLMALVGAAVDYSRAAAIRTAMQTAADTAALAVAKSAATLTEDEIKAQSEALFKATFTRTDAKNLVVTASYVSTGGSKLTVGATATMPTTFLGVMGITEMVLGTKAVSTWGSSRLRVALVLDVTGSMKSDGKLAALKTATKNLLTQLKAAAVNSDDVYVSIIPFVKDVKVDPSNHSENWIYWGTSVQDPNLSDDNSWDAQNGSCNRKVDGSWPSSRSVCYKYACSVGGYTNETICTNNDGCTNPLKKDSNSCTTQNACSKQYSNKNSCENNGGVWAKGTWKRGTWDTNYAWTPANHSNWNGCLADRGDASAPSSGNYDALTTTPSSSTIATLFPAEQYDNCNNVVKPLNNSWTTMSTYVDGLIANGGTNQAIGFVHGWQSLVGGGPYPTPPAIDANYTYKRVIILLSDGENTQDRWYGDGHSTGTADTAKIDAREQLACTNAKNDLDSKGVGITIYAVQVNTGSPKDPTSTVLQNCASPNTTADPGNKFFELTKADAMITTFEQIGTQISKLRIAQ